MNSYKIAVIGNPNCGKTTLFNLLTSSKQTVGNWPGVTVEKKTGVFFIDDIEIELIDLPGIYSLTSYSVDEKVALESILTDNYDLILNIVDATNLERNLYLTIQLLEMKKPIIVILNMVDLLEKIHYTVNLRELSNYLSCPVLSISAQKKTGIELLQQEIIASLEKKQLPDFHIEYDNSIESYFPILSELIVVPTGVKANHWQIMSLFEEVPHASILLKKEANEVRTKISSLIRNHTGRDARTVVTENRYGAIKGILRRATRKTVTKETFSDQVDKVLLHQYWSMPLFLLILYLVFNLSVELAKPFVNLINNLTNLFLNQTVSYYISTLKGDQVWHLLLSDGIIGALQTVLSFAPPIFLIFVSLAILEDSGYMARASYITDRFMRLLGLSGKAFIPMMVGVGCTVPAILAARALESKRDRILASLLVPLIPCGAKLPVYVLFALIFFPNNTGLIIVLLYLFGTLLAIASGFLFKKTLFKQVTSAFVMELPAYHIPTVNAIFSHAWYRLKGFMLRAGKTIFIVTAILTIINSVSWKNDQIQIEQGEESLLAHIGRAISPVFKPMGIDENNWISSVGLFTGLFAKEAIIGAYNATLSKSNTQIIKKPEYIVESKNIATAFINDIVSFTKNLIFIRNSNNAELIDENFSIKMKTLFANINQVIALLLFILIYSPCISSILTLAKETGKVWATFSVIYLTVLAWVIATIYYQITQIGTDLLNSLFWIGICCVIITLGIYLLRFITNYLPVNERG